MNDQSGWAAFVRRLRPSEERVACPKCGQAAGKRCLTANGNVSSSPHKERVSIFRRHIQPDLFEDTDGDQGRLKPR